MYTNPTWQDVSFTVATLGNVLKTLSLERAFLSCDALRMLVKICLTKQEKRKSYQMTNMQKVLVSDNDLIL